MGKGVRREREKHVFHVVDSLITSDVDPSPISMNANKSYTSFCNRERERENREKLVYYHMLAWCATRYKSKLFDFRSCHYNASLMWVKTEWTIENLFTCIYPLVLFQKRSHFWLHVGNCFFDLLSVGFCYYNNIITCLLKDPVPLPDCKLKCFVQLIER